MNELIFSNSGLCNFKVAKGYIVSSYKDGAAWVDDVYVAKEGRVSIKISDRCVGCGEINRTEYRSDGSIVRSLVSDEVSFEQRTELVAKVTSLRSKIYSSPALTQSTKRYLLQGEEVTVVGFEIVDAEEWVEFRGPGEIFTEGWLKCIDLDYCSGN